MTKFLEFLNDTFGIENDTSAPIIITLLVFICGYLLNGIYRMWKTYQIRKNIRRLVRNIISEIINSSKSQSKHFSSFSKQLKLNETDMQPLKITQINSLDSFNRLEYKQVYDAFLNGIRRFYAKKRIKAFNRMWAVISKLNFWNPKHIEEVSAYNSTYNRHINNWNDNMSSFRQLGAQLKLTFHEKNVEPRLREYILEFDKIFQKWQSEKNYTHPEIAHKRLVEPLLLHNKKFFNIPFVLQMNNYLLNLKLHYKNIDKTLIAYYNIFYNHKFTYKGACKILDLCNRILY